jgi:hypothetical protein
LIVKAEIEKILRADNTTCKRKTVEATRSQRLSENSFAWELNLLRFPP